MIFLGGNDEIYTTLMNFIKESLSSFLLLCNHSSFVPSADMLKAGAKANGKTLNTKQSIQRLIV